MVERKPITTWTRPEDIVIIRIRAKIDVEYYLILLWDITVDNFDSYDDEGNKVFDGSAIVGGIFDKSWFKIKTQDMYMESLLIQITELFNTILNVIRMYNMSLFANGVIFALLTKCSATEFIC